MKYLCRIKKVVSIRICFLGMEIVPSKGNAFVGGHVNNAVRLAKGLAAKGHKVQIVTSDTNNSIQQELFYKWGSIYPIHVKGKYASAKKRG